jgi:ankyrin repeat protein
LNDVDINRIGCDTASSTYEVASWSYLWVNEHRLKVFSLDRPRLYEALQFMLVARDFILPEEVLSLSIDRKTYNFEEEISSSKLFLQEVQRVMSWLSPVTHDEVLALSSLQDNIQRLLTLQAMVLSERSQRRDENNVFRRNIYLATLNADEDVALRQGPTERLAEVMRLSRVPIFLTSTAQPLYESLATRRPYIVDLQFTDLSRVDFSKIDFTGVYSIVTKDQEFRFLSEANRHQRYALLYEFARTGDADSLSHLVCECNLDVNVCDPRGTSALMHACIARQALTAKQLVAQHNARVDTLTPSGWDVVSTLCAVRDPHTGEMDRVSREIAEFLVSEAKAKVSVHNAARLGSLQRLKKFSLKELQLLCPATEYSVAHIAARDNNVDILQFLLDKKFDFESALFLSSSSATAAHNFAKENERERERERLQEIERERKAIVSLGKSSRGNSIFHAFSFTGRIANLTHLSTPLSSSSAPPLSSSTSLIAVNTAAVPAMILVETDRPSSLWVACEHGRTSAALFLSQRVPSLRSKAFRCLSPAKVALRAGHYDLLRELWHGEKLQHEIKSCVMDVEVAVALREREWIEQHLATMTSTSSSKQAVQQSLLFACKYDWAELAQCLLTDHGASLSHRFEKEFQQRAVDVVCSLGHGALMSLLLSYRDDIESTQSLSDEGHSQQDKEAERVKQEETSWRTGFSLNESNSSCPPLIFTAIARRRWEIVRLLLDHSVNLSLVHDGRTALHALLGSSEGDKAKEQVDPLYLSLPLRCELVRLMLAKGASVTVRDREGQTALHYAVRTSDEVASLVLRAFVNIRNTRGETALDLAENAGVDMTIWRD